MTTNPNISYIPLSSLKNGESGIIIKVKGYGAFRKRITEMGFVPGVAVKAIKRAPLQDPVEYELMGYRVSLRKSEAELIEMAVGLNSEIVEKPFEGIIQNGDTIEKAVKEKIKTINVALVGNPNSGKTSLFNRATKRNEKVGNYGGVTVDMKTARFIHHDYTINITDLPGTYSISEYSPEELFVRKYLTDEMPDVVINVLDASNIERNLYLTTQLIDMNIKIVVALNMYDELEKKGDNFDYQTLGKMIGIPFVPVVAIKGKGISELLDKVIDVYEEKESDYRHIHINYGKTINNAIEKLREEIKKNSGLNDRYHAHYTAIKLLENDHDFIKWVQNILDSEVVISCAWKQIKEIEREYKENSTSVITDAKYAFIHGALKETYQAADNNKVKEKRYSIDNILTHKWLGLPVFMLFMLFIFQATFILGAYPMEWIEKGVALLGDVIQNIMSEGALRDLITGGLIDGVGSVIVFFPNIMILFIFISFMEDTGYMARVAFLMDKLMHKIGLHGKSVIPILMGFGCNVPAIMATRTLENHKDRILTMLMIPFVSCSTKLPIYILFVSALFASYRGLIVFSIYLIGIVLGILTALLIKKKFSKKKDIPFVMELPPYRLPTFRNTVRHMWGKSDQYLRKMGGVILIGSVIIWALSYFPRTVNYSQDYDTAIVSVENNTSIGEDTKQEQIIYLKLAQQSEHMSQSYVGRLGHFVEPVIRPLGYDWKIGVGLISGLAAKEFVISTMGILYQSVDDGSDRESADLINKIRQQEYTSGPKAMQKVFTPVAAYSLMLFILIYFPCVAVIAAIRKEAGWRWAIFLVFYSTLLAWIVAFIATLIGKLF
ncbi:MAG: ferrous iron transport protein B [Prevotellaceae bacterium]|jgi:ferrous iron transport protein B|nr:ferrous iron transport protein B [Prevotellaceae bacterium]